MVQKTLRQCRDVFPLEVGRKRRFPIGILFRHPPETGGRTFTESVHSFVLAVFEAAPITPFSTGYSKPIKVSLGSARRPVHRFANVQTSCGLKSLAFSARGLSARHTRELPTGSQSSAGSTGVARTTGFGLFSAVRYRAHIMSGYGPLSAKNQKIIIKDGIMTKLADHPYYIQNGKSFSFHPPKLRRRWALQSWRCSHDKDTSCKVC